MASKGVEFINIVILKFYFLQENTEQRTCSRFKSVFGKILKINLIGSSHKVIAMGLRNTRSVLW